MRTAGTDEKTHRLRSRGRAKPRSPVGKRDEELAAFEALWMRDPVAARISKSILVRQRSLRRAVDQRAWLLYLAVEEAVNHRQAHLLELACALWSDTGRKSRGTRRTAARG